MLVLETPVRLRLPKNWVGSRLHRELQDELGYEDLGVTHEWRRHRKMQQADNLGRRCWFVEQNGRAALDALVEKLEGERFQNCLFQDAAGLWTYSGLRSKIAELSGDKEVTRGYSLPEHRNVPWENPPKFQPRWFQSKSVDLLVPAVHGGVELATGLGKSMIAALLLKRLGLPAVVMAPTLSIAEQLLKDLTSFFGKKRVGKFFDGKKESDKHFVVAVSKSLTSLETNSPLWEGLRAKSVLIGDESHLLPAETLSRVVLGELGNIPYRFFLSGTQIRTDGLQKVLEGIVGDIVLEMDVQQGVKEGFLSPLRFFQFEISSKRDCHSSDVLRLNREHLHKNPAVYKHVTKLVTWGLGKGRRPLVLVEEVAQFPFFLAEYLKGGGSLDRLGFAHGGVSKDQREKMGIPERFWKSDPSALVEAFDNKEIDVLVGTSCIGIGTDVKSASLICDLVGNKAEAQIRQRAGRGTRLFPGKTDCIFVDYNVSNVEKLEKHAKERAKIFKSIMGEVTYEKAK